MSAMAELMRIMAGNKVLHCVSISDDESDESPLTSWDRGRGLS